MRVKLSDRARQGLEDLAGDVSVSALLEAIGEMAADGVEAIVDASVFDRAAEIQRLRRARSVE